MTSTFPSTHTNLLREKQRRRHRPPASLCSHEEVLSALVYSRAAIVIKTGHPPSKCMCVHVCLQLLHIAGSSLLPERREETTGFLTPLFLCLFKHLFLWLNAKAEKTGTKSGQHGETVPVYQHVCPATICVTHSVNYSQNINGR